MLLHGRGASERSSHREPKTYLLRRTLTPVANSFRTRTGRCLVVDGTITIDSDGAGRLGTLREALTSDAIPPWRRAATVLFLVAVVAALFFAVQVLPAWLPGAVAGLVLALLVWSWYGRRGRRPDEEEIAVENVVGVDAYAGVPLLTRPRFVLRYRSEGGVKHRYVQCPSRVYGFDAFRTGLDIFERHGILATEETDGRERVTSEF